MLTATTQTTGNLQTAVNSATGKALNSVQKLDVASSRHPHQYRPVLDISSMNHLSPAHPYDIVPEINSSASLPYAHHYFPALDIGSSAPSPYAQQYNPNHHPSLPSSIVLPQPYDSSLNYELNAHRYLPPLNWPHRHHHHTLTDTIPIIILARFLLSSSLSNTILHLITNCQKASEIFNIAILPLRLMWQQYFGTLSIRMLMSIHHYLSPSSQLLNTTILWLLNCSKKPSAMTKTLLFSPPSCRKDSNTIPSTILRPRKDWRPTTSKPEYCVNLLKLHLQ